MSSNENQTPEPNNEIPIDSNPPSKTENKKKKKKGTIDRPDAELLAKLKEEKHERRRKQHEESIEFNNILHHIPKVPHSKWIDLPLDLENDFQHKNKLFSRSLPSNSNEKAPRFTIASYNILSQHLVRREVYSYASEKALKWVFRKHILLQDLKDLDVDILCLQEIDYFDDYFNPEMTKLGYDSKYKQKEGKFDGCAIFWKRNRFSLVKYHDIDFNAREGDSEFKQEVNRDNVAQFISLRFCGEGEDGQQSPRDFGITISNTHLFWNPIYCFVRLRQIHELKKNLALFNRSVTKEREAQSSMSIEPYPMLSVGDFNITPDNIMFKALTEHGFVYDGEEEIESLLIRFSSLDKDNQGTQIVEERKSKPHSIVSFLTPPEHGDPRVSWVQRLELSASLFQSKEAMEVRFKETMEMIHGVRKGQVPRFVSCYGDYQNLIHHWEQEKKKHQHGQHFESEEEINGKILGERLWQGEPWFTTFTEFFRAVLDYIFLALDDGESDDVEEKDRSSTTNRNHGIVRTRIMRIPLATVLQKHKGIPSDVFPSDHIPIGVEFAFV